MVRYFVNKIKCKTDHKTSEKQKCGYFLNKKTTKNLYTPKHQPCFNNYQFKKRGCFSNGVFCCSDPKREIKIQTLPINCLKFYDSLSQLIEKAVMYNWYLIHLNLHAFLFVRNSVVPLLRNKE